MPSVSAKQAKLMSAIDHGWQPPASMKHAPSKAVAHEFHEADKRVGKFMHADGGQIRVGQREAPAPDDSERTEHLLGLVSHAADRVYAKPQDSHHLLSRVAAGLASQVAGQSPSGRVQMGRLPNLVNEAKALPAGLVDLSDAGANILGSLARKYLPQTPGTAGWALGRLQDAANAYTDQHGDPAPGWSRRAEAAASAMHDATNRAMGLRSPRGFAENAAEAGGVMLGQLPVPASEARTAERGVQGGLAMLAHAIPEYLGPTVRPKASHYLQGALGGGALGAAASSGDDNTTPTNLAASAP